MYVSESWNALHKEANKNLHLYILVIIQFVIPSSKEIEQFWTVLRVAVVSTDSFVELVMTSFGLVLWFLVQEK